MLKSFQFLLEVAAHGPVAYVTVEIHVGLGASHAGVLASLMVKIKLVSNTSPPMAFLALVVLAARVIALCMLSSRSAQSVGFFRYHHASSCGLVTTYKGPGLGTAARRCAVLRARSLRKVKRLGWKKGALRMGLGSDVEYGEPLVVWS